MRNVYAIAPPIRSASTLREQVLDHLELVGDLRAAEDRDERPVGIVKRLAEVLDLGGHQEPGGRLAHVMDDALGRRVRAMRGAERVVDVDVAERRECRRERGIVRLFLGVEAQILEQDDAARRWRRPRSAAWRSDAVGREGDGLSEQRRSDGPRPASG